MEYLGEREEAVVSPETSCITVLFVEPDPMDAIFIRKELGDERALYRITNVRDGVEAVDYLRNAEKKRPDLILLAENVPAITGAQLLQILDSDEKLQQIPLVFIQRNREGSPKGKFSLLARTAFSDTPAAKRLTPLLRAINNYLKTKK